MPEVSRKWHEDVSLTTAPDLSNLPKVGSPEEIAHDLDGFDALEGWINARRAYAHQLAEQGTEIPGYQLVEKIGNRKWIDDVKASEGLVALGLGDKQIFEEKMRSPAQIEKILGAKRKGEIATLTERPARGTNLVSVALTTRPAAKTLTERHHETVETEK